MSDDAPDPATDPFKPPAIPTVVGCLHCGEEYDSYLIEWRVSTSADGKQYGFWCCPTPGCDGAGFLFDIFPVDPEYRDENGEKIFVSDDEDEEDEDYNSAEGLDDPLPGEHPKDDDSEAGEEEIPF